MPSYIHALETATPAYSYSQSEIRDRMKEIVPASDKDKRIIHYLYSRSGIDNRHSVINDFRQKGSQTLFFNGEGAYPGTERRNDLYIREAKKLFVEAARSLIENSDFEADQITHLITVSCTGFYAPGPDFDIIRALNLNPSIERYHLGFMGCYASIPAIKMADQICRANKDANVMVVSVELCTIHFQANPEPDSILSASVFADGGAGFIMSNKKPTGKKGIAVHGFASTILEKGKDDMAWSIGDKGFSMVLSSYIPDLLKEGIDEFLNPALDRFGITTEQIEQWCVHPGGRAILDRIEEAVQLPPDALDASRKVLSGYGNMSSATILFVLRELQQQTHQKENSRILAMAFGPGLTMETALLSHC
ncbi:type III polyketide synthase [Rhodohalobacter mucosus]|uniref:Type III polyketide synthase n=1 Tax=Rhodohalobacter mucosus TaxID=2079485 RepID=A0A316TNJ9_9BACT|nr:type III polyketide synthase [Rhodohalobacter mucosus]PWN05221.1 type III polyketide synthase [Rhodohalobacter mucosus]